METTIHERFMEAFRWTGLTSNGLANKLKMNARTIWNYTNTDREPSYECLSKLCQVFPMLNFDWIMDGTGNMLKGTPQLDENGQPLFLQAEQPVPSASAGSTTSKVEQMYEKMIAMLEEQLKKSEKRCSDLEEQNRILLSLMPKQNNG